MRMIVVHVVFWYVQQFLLIIQFFSSKMEFDIMMNRIFSEYLDKTNIRVRMIWASFFILLFIYFTEMIKRKREREREISVGRFLEFHSSLDKSE